MEHRNVENRSGYEELIALIEEADGQEFIVSEFEETHNPDKPFRWEFAMESVTEYNTRFKRRVND